MWFAGRSGAGPHGGGGGEYEDYLLENMSVSFADSCSLPVFQVDISWSSRNDKYMTLTPPSLAALVLKVSSGCRRPMHCMQIGATALPESNHFVKSTPDLIEKSQILITPLAIYSSSLW